MPQRIAECGCCQLRAACEGDPIRVAVCHCHACQRRTGSAFAQARFPAERVSITGEWSEWTRTGDSGGKATFRFCPRCGATVAYEGGGFPGLIAIPVGAFADNAFPAPAFSV